MNVMRLLVVSFISFAALGTSAFAEAGIHAGNEVEVDVEETISARNTLGQVFSFLDTIVQTIQEKLVVGIEKVVEASVKVDGNEIASVRQEVEVNADPRPVVQQTYEDAKERINEEAEKAPDMGIEAYAYAGQETNVRHDEDNSISAESNARLFNEEVAFELQASEEDEGTASLNTAVKAHVLGMGVSSESYAGLSANSDPLQTTATAGSAIAARNGNEEVTKSVDVSAGLR